MIQSISAVIVPSRIGRHLKTPVPLLPFGDTTVLQRTLSAYQEAGFGEIILVLSYRAAELEASLRPAGSGFRVVTSPNPEEEYPGLIRRGLDQISSGVRGFALGLGDQPLLDKEVLQDLAARFTRAKKRILVPVWQGHLGHPLFFDMSMAAELKKLKPHDDPWDVLKTHGQDVYDYHIFHTSVVRHIEDMEDYHTLLTLAGLPVPETDPFPVSGDGGPPQGGSAAPAPEGAPGSPSSASSAPESAPSSAVPPHDPNG